jgi:polysaccharide export outer membrane protein
LLRNNEMVAWTMRLDTSAKLALVFVSALALASCSGLPSDGPSSGDIADQSVAPRDGGIGEFSLVQIDQTVVDSLREPAEPNLGVFFGDSTAEVQELIKIGDYVVVTVWEADGGGLLSGGVSTQSQAPSGSISSIPEQPVLRSGTIVVPYAGRIRIANRTTEDAENLIKAALRNKLSNPQVLVTVTHGYSNQVTVTGDAIKGALVTLTPNANRILDIVANAGGSLLPSDNVRVAIDRGGHVARIDLSSILHNPSQNIRLLPGDTLVFSKTEKRFTALGAFGKVATVPFETNQVSLAQAIGDAGGLLDERADPSGVFVFRYEPHDRAAKVCNGCAMADGAQFAPIVYRLDMSKATGYFFAQSFAMQDRDVVYVSNADKIQLQKFLAMIRDLTSPILTGAVVTRAVSR